MWIRSQSQMKDGKTDYKALVNCNWFALRDYGNFYAIEGGINDPVGEDGGFWLGQYPAEAEALKVVDMIEERIIDIEKSKFLGMEESCFVNPVFQMPEAGFSAKPEKFIPDCGADLNHCGLLDKEIDPLSDKCPGFAECKAAYDRGCR